MKLSWFKKKEFRFALSETRVYGNITCKEFDVIIIKAYNWWTAQTKLEKKLRKNGILIGYCAAANDIRDYINFMRDVDGRNVKR